MNSLYSVEQDKNCWGYDSEVGIIGRHTGGSSSEKDAEQDQNIESNNKIISKEKINKFLNEKNYKYFERLEKRARNKLIKRYDKTISYHALKMITDFI